MLSLSHRQIDCAEKFDVELDKNMEMINDEERDEGIVDFVAPIFAPN